MTALNAGRSRLVGQFPLVLFVPNVWALKQRNHEPLRVHEDQLRCSDLCFHRVDKEEDGYGTTPVNV